MQHRQSIGTGRPSLVETIEAFDLGRINSIGLTGAGLARIDDPADEGPHCFVQDDR